MLDFLHGFLLLSPPPGEGGSQSILPTLFMFGAIILVMYFLMIRPQKKRQKEHQQMIDSIGKGDKVITSSGMHGTVTDKDEKTLEVQIADNVRVRFEKNSITAKKDK